MEANDVRAEWNANAPAWTALTRAGFDVYRDRLNTPAFLSMLPPVRDLVGLDVGCGEGHNTRLLGALGARLVALDVAERLVAAAAAAGGDGLSFVGADAARLPFASGTFDFVTAFMSLMDMTDPDAALREAARVLRPGGFVQFSIVHPMNNTGVRRWITDDDGRRRAVAVGDYFDEGTVTERWTFRAAPAEVRDGYEPFVITSVRRTLSSWLNAVAAADLILEAVAEPFADEATARADPRLADTRILPYFLIVRARTAA